MRPAVVSEPRERWVVQHPAALIKALSTAKSRLIFATKTLVHRQGIAGSNRRAGASAPPGCAGEFSDLTKKKKFSFCFRILKVHKCNTRNTTSVTGACGAPYALRKYSVNASE